MCGVAERERRRGWLFLGGGVAGLRSDAILIQNRILPSESGVAWVEHVGTPFD